MISLRHTCKTGLFFLILLALMMGTVLPSIAASRRQPAKNQRTISKNSKIASVRNQKQIGKPVKQVGRESVSSRNRLERRRLEARRRAESARLAAIARQHARDAALRARVQEMIAKDDPTGEDAEVRRIAVTALGNHAGTVVVMDPKTGRVYTIVNQQWALREGFKPCSTIKLVTGLAGLNERVIDPLNTADISDSNRVDLTKALAYSKNDYFQQVGGQVGFAKMIEYARQLGLGEKTGINGRTEFAGRLPLQKSGFGLNRMSSHGDDFQVTALQLATLVSAMANGGKLLAPQIALPAKGQPRFTSRVRREVKIDPEIWRHMVPGMVGAVNYGSGRKAYDPAKTVAGKTGTCIEQGGWVGLFTSYAPLSNPTLAVVVIARGPDARSHFPAAVAGRIYRELNGRFGTPESLQIAAKTDSYTQIAATDGNELDEEEAAELERAKQAEAEVISRRAKIASPISEQNNKVKRVLMQIPSRPLPVVAAPQRNVVPQIQTRPRRVLINR